MHQQQLKLTRSDSLQKEFPSRKQYINQQSLTIKDQKIDK